MQAVFTDEIKAVHERIAEKIGDSQYQVWFEGTTRLTMNEDHFEIASATSTDCFRRTNPTCFSLSDSM